MAHETVQDWRASVAHLPTKSARIRALAKLGLKRADIARALGIRYQHVRNVLVADEERRQAKPVKPDSVTVSVDSAGRVLIPVVFREWFALQEGSRLVLHAGPDGLELTPPSRAADKARALLRPFLEPGLNLSDELIADRRVEAAREDG